MSSSSASCGGARRRFAAFAGVLAAGTFFQMHSAWAQAVQPTGDPAQPTESAAAATQGQTAAENVPIFQVTPTISLEETFTDNVNLTSTQPMADWLSAITAGFSSSLQTRKTQFNANYGLTEDIYLKNSQINGYLQNLLAVGRTEPIADHLSIDFRASLEQTPLNEFGAVSDFQRTVPTNQTETLNFGISPQYVQRLSDWGIATVNYSLNRVDFISPSVGDETNSPGAGTVHDLTASLASGSLFTRLLWRLEVSDSFSVSSGDQLTDRSEEAHGEYRVSRSIGIPASVGYDSYTGGGNGFPSNDVSGVFWDAGIHLTPGPRTDFTVTYGRRYNGPYWQSNLVYRVTPAITFQSTYTTSLETQQQAFAGALNQLSTGSNGGIVSPYAGTVKSAPGLGAASLVNAPFLEKELQFGVTGIRGRNSLSLTGSTVDQTFGGVLPNQYSENLAVTYTRQLSRVTSLTLSLAPTRSKIDGTGSETDIEALADFSYRLSDKTTAALEVRRNHQAGTTDIVEDAVMVTLTKAF